MKFKTHLSKEIKFKGILSCIDWSGIDEIYTCSDDHQIFKWSITNRDSQQIAKLPDDFFPTDLNWLVTKTTGSGKSNDSLLISSNDGRFIILNRSARVEKNITAHTATITSIRWSPDGAGLLTAGEDGIIKVWSRSGMLRSTVIQNEGSILCARWAPNSTSIVYCQSNNIVIKPLAANSKVIKWKAHDGLVLCLSWANNTNVIASGGEDCRYKLWDTQGTSVYVSAAEEHAITAVEFSSNGEMLAVGGFNMLKLCHHSGWVYNNIRFSSPSTGSLFNIRWSSDGTQIVAGSGIGVVLFGHVIEEQKVSRNLKATTIGRKTMILEDIVGQTKDTLDFTDRIVEWELGYGHLVVATSTQVQIFNENYVNTPIIVDGRSDVRIIILGKKNFLIVDNASIWVYTYTGRLHLNPRYGGSQVQIPNLITEHVSLGLDILSIRDFADTFTMHVFDLLPGASRQDEPFVIKSKTPVLKIAICRAGNSEDQYLAYIDINNDLYLTNARGGPDFSMYKIGNQVTAIMWSSECNILVGLRDTYYTIWYCPGEACADPTLLTLSSISFETSEFGKNLTITNFEGSSITFCGSGVNYTIAVKSYCEVIHKCIADGMWKQALKICRLAQNPMLWSILAAIASKKNQVDISEEAYANALQIDKVYYLQYIKDLPKGSSEQMSEFSVMNGRVAEAELVLLHNKKISEAIGLAMRMHRWERALEIAQKYETEVDVVVEERKKYFKILGRNENNEKFLTIKDVKAEN